jgi:hypothetical protein
MTDRLQPELPPQSRISSRIDGSEMTLLIPRANRRQIPGGWTAAFGFLAITFTAQGFLSGNRLWSAGGFLFFLLTACQLLFRLGSSLRNSGEIKLQITPDVLTAITGPAEAPMHRHWPRSAISSIRAEPPKLNLYLASRQPSVCLLSGLDPAELAWISDQIHRKWNWVDQDGGK